MSAPADLLTADLGNSSLKLRLWSLRGAAARGVDELRLACGPELPAELAGWRAGRALARRGALVAVATPALEETVALALAARLETPLVRAPEPGVVNACDSPETVGLDRLYAARGAFERVHGPCVVVDAGTALTVDAVGIDARRPVFLGGAIAPGPALLADALARGGARLRAVEPAPGVPALGRDTPSALRAGIAVGFRGAALELVRRVAEEAGLARAPVVVTGGARGFLLEPEPFLAARPATPLTVAADLVHEGLLAALAGAPAAAGDPG